MINHKISLVTIIINLIDLIVYIDENIMKRVYKNKIEIINKYYNHICYNCNNEIDGIMYCYKDNYYCSEDCRNKYINE